MKTTKGGKVMNPTDAYRKELRKKELKRNKKERKKVREVGILKKDPEAIREQIRKLETMKADGALDKTRRHKKRQLEDTLKLVLKKRKEYEEKMREKGEEPIMFSHLSAPRRRTAEEEQKAKQMRPEDSVYFHPTLNPTGAPPPGKPPMYKSSIGSSIPLSEDGDMESEMAIPIPPPPPLPMGEGSSSAEDQAFIPLAVPVPPPPPAPPRPSGSVIPSLPPPPPPPPGFPPKPRSQIPPPPPPPLPRQMQPPPPGTGVTERAGPPGIEEISERLSNHDRVPAPKAEGKSEPIIEETQDMDVSQIPPASLGHQTVNSLPLPLPPPPPPPSMMRPLQGPVPHVPSHEMLPSGMPRLPPPPPPGLRPPLTGPSFPTRILPTGLPMGHPPPLGQIPPTLGRPQIGMPGVPFPPMAQRPEINPLDDPGKAVKASFVKSAAPTVVKRPLAQHTPELTSMVPASVLVRRESAQKSKSKPSTSHSVVNVTKVSAPQHASKPQSIDDSYSAFLEDMKALGAFDGDFS